MLHPGSSHLWQVIDVQALGVKLLQWDMCRVQPVHLKSHQWNIFPQSKLMPQVKISPGDRTRPGPGCPSTASPVPQPRCSSTWSARNPLSGPLTRSPSGRRSAPGQTPCWLFATVIITMKVEIYQIYTIYNIDTGDGDVLPCRSWRRGWRTLPQKDLGAVGPRRAIDQSYRHRLTPENIFILSNIWLLKHNLPIYFPLTPTFIDFDFVFLGTNDIEIAWYFSISIENLNRTAESPFAWVPTICVDINGFLDICISCNFHIYYPNQCYSKHCHLYCCIFLVCCLLWIVVLLDEWVWDRALLLEWNSRYCQTNTVK